MNTIGKFKTFLSDLQSNHPNKAFFEGIMNAVNVIFESQLPPKLAKIVDVTENEGFQGAFDNPAPLNSLNHAINKLDIEKLRKTGALNEIISMIYKDFAGAIGDLKSGDINSADKKINDLADTVTTLGRIGIKEIQANLSKLPKDSDFTTRDIAAGKAGEGYGGKKIAAGFWKDMVGDSFVGHIGTSKAQQLHDTIVRLVELANSDDEEVARDAQYDLDAFDQLKSLYYNYDQAVADNIRQSTLDNFDYLFTRGATDPFSWADAKEVADETGINKVGLKDHSEQEDEFTKKLILKGATKEQATKYKKDITKTVQYIRQRFFDYLLKTHASAINTEISEKAQDVIPSKVEDYTPWPYQQQKGTAIGQGKGAKVGAKGGHQRMATKVLNYFHKGVRDPEIDQMRKSLANMGMTLVDLYKMITEPVSTAEKKQTLLDRIKKRMLEKTEKQSQKDLISNINLEEGAFDEFKQIQDIEDNDLKLVDKDKKKDTGTDSEKD